MFVGWDWASTTHDVTVLDDAGAVVDRWAFRHTEQDLAGALDRLAGLTEPTELPVIIERTSGLVVDRLVAAGHPVVPVHPTAFWAARPRWGASGAKSDAGDSYKLADYLRTDGHRLRRLDRSDPGLQELQALVRLREDHVRARTAASMKLGALLEAHWPGPKAVFYRLASPIALAFLADYPTPQAAARLGEARMASFCRRHSYRGGKSPAVLLARLRSAPTAPVGIPPATLATLVRTQVQLLHTLLVTIAELESWIATRVACHPRAKLLASLPGVGTINLAQLLAEVGPILDRVDSAEHAAAECGAAPVTKASGKTSGVYFRWAANRRARKALTAFAHNSRLASPWAGGCTPTLAPAASATHTPPASSPAPGSGSSGPAGSKPPPTTPPSTPPLSEPQLSQLDSED
jgi:transposase